METHTNQLKATKIWVVLFLTLGTQGQLQTQLDPGPRKAYYQNSSQLHFPLCHLHFNVHFLSRGLFFQKYPPAQNHPNAVIVKATDSWDPAQPH